MAFLHKISGYLVDVNEDYFEEDIVTEIEQGMDLFSQHLHVETAQIKGWDDENPLNYRNCDLAECEKYFKVKVPKVDNNRKVVYVCTDGKVWHRPLWMFLSEVDHNKYPDAKQLYRFELVE